MNDISIRTLLPALPEIVLALGAMALLMLGAYRERSTRIVNLGAIMLLIAAAFIVAVLPNGTTFGGSFVVDDFARFLKILAFIGSAVAIVMSLDYLAAERQQNFEYSDPDPALDRRHGHADLGRRPDRALSRPRADEPRALRGRGLEPRQRALDRSRA